MSKKVNRTEPFPISMGFPGYKCVFFAIDEEEKISGVFVHGKHFQPSPINMNKARSLP
jgi:hypothetical protein